MKQRFAFAALLALVALGLVANPRLARAPADIADASENYEELVGELSDAGLLAAAARPAQPGERVVFARPANNSLGSKACAPDCAALLGNFARNSFLGLDMLDANAAFWRRDGSAIIGMVPGSHGAPGIAARLAGWDQTVFYRGGRAFPRLNLVESTGGPVRQFGGNTACPLLAPDQCGAGPLVHGAEFRLTDAQGRNLVLRRLGDHVLVITPHRLDGLTATIDGRALVPPAQGDAQSDARGQFLLAPGQTFGVALGGNEHSFQLIEEPGTLASQGPRGRLRNPHLAAPMRALEAAAPEGPVESSITIALQQALEGTLAEASVINADPSIPMRSAALMMDGLTGEIRALATYPVVPAQVPEHLRDTNQGRALLAQNNALAPLAVGSAAKVPFAAAIADRWPGLIAFKLPCAPGRFGAVLGQELRGLSGQPVTLGDHCDGPDTSFREFIAFSSNRYALSLLEIARRRGASAPDWRARLYEITCMIPYSRRNRGPQQGWETRDADCARALWRSPQGRNFRSGDIGANTVPFARTYLRLNAVDNLFADYYQSVLGGNRGFMPLIGLAQSYARIVSDRRVSARMSAGALPRPASLGQKQAVWKALMDGMWGTIARTGGTGQAGYGALARAMGANRGGYFLLAKTGTPTVELTGTGGTKTAADGNTLVLVAIRSRTGAVPQSAADLCAVRILATNFQYREPGRAAPSARLANALVRGAPLFREWLSAPCG